MGLDMTIGKKKGKASYPTKNFINLVGAGEQPVNRRKQIIIFVVVLVVILLLAKFAVYDVASSVSASSNRLSTAQNELNTLKSQNADFKELQAQYDSIFANGMSDEEQNLVNRSNMLDTINANLPSTSILQSVSVKGNVANLSFTNATLSDVSNMVGNLDADESVSAVTMSTVNNEDGNVTTSITITFKGPFDGDDTAGAATTDAQGTATDTGTTTSASSTSQAAAQSQTTTGGGAK